MLRWRSINNRIYVIAGLRLKIDVIFPSLTSVPAIQGQGFASEGGNPLGVSIVRADPAQQDEVSPVTKSLIAGRRVFKMMRELNRESAVAFVMVTHDERLAQEADRILMIEDGLIHEVNKNEQRQRMLDALNDANP